MAEGQMQVIPEIRTPNGSIVVGNTELYTHWTVMASFRCFDWTAIPGQWAM